MWLRFNSAQKNAQLELDPNINNPADNRRGVTALAYLNSNDDAVTYKIKQFLTDLAKIEPSQYYYPQEDLHLTILSIITCIEGFILQSINPRSYKDSFLAAVSDTESIEINFSGVTATPQCVLIQGFPVGSGLDILRQRLRDVFKQSGLRTSIDKRYLIETAHCTAVRFRSPIQNSERLLECLEKYRNYDFGSIHLNRFDLVFNDWYQRKANTIAIAQYPVENSYDSV